jgi:hypothetical protein
MSTKRVNDHRPMMLRSQKKLKKQRWPTTTTARTKFGISMSNRRSQQQQPTTNNNCVTCTFLPCFPVVARDVNNIPQMQTMMLNHNQVNGNCIGSDQLIRQNSCLVLLHVQSASTKHMVGDTHSARSEIFRSLACINNIFGNSLQKAMKVLTVQCFVELMPKSNGRIFAFGFFV